MKSSKELKNRLKSPFVLALPRTENSFVLDTDSNVEQLGCVLFQEQDEESLRPVGYFTRKLYDAERNYDSNEREYLAIIGEVLMFRPYFEWARLTLRTNQHALKWVFGPASTSGKLSGWRIRLQELSFTVAYLFGKKNITADAMYLLHTKGVHDTKTLIDIELFVLSIEDDVNPPTLDDKEVAIPEEDEDGHPKLAKPMPLEEMLALQRVDLECSTTPPPFGLRQAR